MRSAYEEKQNMIGIGMLWKYGYYDQGRNENRTLATNIIEKPALTLITTISKNKEYH